MRILLVSEDIPHATLGGLGKHVVTLGNALIEAGHTVDLMGNTVHPNVHTPGDVAFKGGFLPGLDPTGANWKEDRLGFFNYLRHAYQARRFARAILAVARDYDVIHYHGHQPILANYIPRSVNFVQTRHDQGSACLIYTRFRNGEVCRATDPRACAACATPRPNLLQGALSAWSVRLWRRAVTNAFRRHKVIFVSQCLRTNAERTLGALPGATARISHNFVDAQYLRRGMPASKTNGEQPDVFIAARIDAAKGVDAFINAFGASQPLRRHVTIAGDGPLLDMLRASKSVPSIYFMGWQPYHTTVNMAANAATIIVPSVCEESCATTVLEGLVLGRPVLALKRGGTPELKVYERYPNQLQLFDSMAELVAALSDTAAPVPALQGLGFAGDVRAHLGEMESVYRQEVLH